MLSKQSKYCILCKRIKSWQILNIDKKCAKNWTNFYREIIVVEASRPRLHANSLLSLLLAGRLVIMENILTDKNATIVNNFNFVRSNRL